MAEVSDNVETETFQRLQRLRQLRIEHRDLDDVIHRLQLARLESQLIPDLNA
jgi:hypothetical protein